jgi:hypothetical protein
MSFVAVEGQERGGDGPTLAAGVVEPFAFEQQGGAVVLEPGLEHGSLVEEKRGLLSAGIVEVFDHRGLLSC